MAILANIIIEVIIAFLVLATPVGFVGAIVFIAKAVESKEKRKRRNMVLYAIISFFTTTVLLFVVLSLWGLAHILFHSAVR